MKNIYELVRDNLKHLTPYSTARDDCKSRMSIYLDANENPYDNGVNRYPSPHQEELKKKVEQLITLYISSLERHRELEAEVKAVRDRLETLKNENNKLKEEIKTLKVAKAISTGEGSAEARNRINQLVREIDKCIALLNN